MGEEEKQVYDKALELLVRREHSIYELRRKLLQRSYDEKLIEKVLETLVNNNYLSDVRFTQEFIYFKAKRGYGPNWLKAALINKGISKSIIERTIENSDIDWNSILSNVREKKYGKEYENIHITDKRKQYAFLKTRGFTFEQINNLYKMDKG